MTLGDILILIKNIKDTEIQKNIANHFGIINLNVFFSYIDTIRVLRNLCAHGHNIFDLNLNKSIKAGVLKSEMTGEMHHNLCGFLLVMLYLLKFISINRCYEMKKQLKEELNRPDTASLGQIINYISDVL